MILQFIKNHKIALLILAVFLATVGASYYIFHGLFESARPGVADATAEISNEKEPENKTINFLLLGVDERSGDVGRSDTIMMLSANLATKRIGLVSVPRDSRVDMIKYGSTKVNHAYAYGGITLAKQTIEKLLNVKADHYFVINFSAFKKIINLLGGVDLDVEKDMYYRDDYDGENGLVIDLQKGQQHLDAEKAIEYVRYRDEEGDIGRVKRQQKFLNAVLAKFTSPSTILKIPSIIKEVRNSIQTDMSFADMVEYLSFLKNGTDYKTTAFMVPGSPQMIDDLSYWIVNYPKLYDELQAMNNFILDRENTPPPATKEEEVATKEQGVFRESIDDKQSTVVWQVDDTKSDEMNEKEAEIRAKLRADEDRERAELAEQRRYQEWLKNQQTGSETGIKIINTTTDSEKTSQAQRVLRNAGVEVGTITDKSTGTPNPRTIVIVSERDKETQEAVKNLPFRCSVITKKGDFTPTLIIGEDF
jgi:regulation of penicillin binding protein 5 production